MRAYNSLKVEQDEDKDGQNDDGDDDDGGVNFDNGNEVIKTTVSVLKRTNRSPKNCIIIENNTENMKWRMMSNN